MTAESDAVVVEEIMAVFPVMKVGGSQENKETSVQD
jgi:hypothetical protein